MVVRPWRAGSFVPHCSSKIAAEGLVFDGAVVGEVHGDGADVAGALDVVLAAEGVEAGAAAADVAGGEGKVDEGEAGLGAVGVLGDAEAPVEAGLVGVANDVGGAFEGGWGDAGEGFLAFGGPVADGGGDGLEVLDAVGDKVFVDEAVANDDVEQGVVHGDVGAGAALEMHVGPAGEFDGARVGDDEFGAAADGGLHLEGGDGVGLGGVGAGDVDDVVFGDLVERVGEGAGADAEAEGGDGGGVAEAGAVVDVVGAEDDAGEFLEEVVVLVEALGGAVDGEGVGAVGVADLGEAAGDVVEGFVPGGAAPAAGASLAGANEGVGEAVVALGVVPAEAALDAEPALVDGVILGRHGVGDLTAADVDFEPAADAAEGAGGFDDAVVLDDALLLEFPLGAALEGAGGAYLDAVAAIDAGGVHDAVVLEG